MPTSMQPNRASDEGAQMTERRRPKHSGSISADGRVGRWTLRRLAGVCRRAPRCARQLSLRRRPPRLLLAGRCARRLCGEPGHRTVRARLQPARPALSGFGRLPDRRARPVRGDQAGGSAIIAVKLASAASLPSTLARPANLHTLRALLDEFDFQLEQARPARPACGTWRLRSP